MSERADSEKGMDTGKFCWPFPSLSLFLSLSLILSLSLSVYVSLVDVNSETGIVGWKHGTMTENLISSPDAYATLGVPL
jgi:hypothetical protein